MTALASATSSVNELLALVQERKPWRSHAGMTAMLVVVVASIASSLSYTVRADRDVDQQFQNKLSLYREEAQRISAAEQSKEEALALAREATIDATLADALPRSRAIAEVSNATPAGVRLTAISLDSDPQSAQPSDTPGVARYLHIQGIATTDAQLSQFVIKLSKSHWLQGVNVLKHKGEVHQFEIAAIFSGSESRR